MEITIREISESDYPLFEDFLFNAIYFPLGEKPSSRDVIYNPDVSIYIDGFGSKPGDCGVIAWIDGKAIGAAWTRIIPAYGHIDNNTPELATSVLSEYRNRKVCEMLMNRLFQLLKMRGYRQTSLADQQNNDAVRFYERLGYMTIRQNDEEFIMVKDL